MNHLVFNGYIRLTDDEYPVLELNERSEAVLGGECVAMKVAKEQPKSAEKKQKKKKLPAGPEGEVDRDLFEKLRALRLEIAKREKVPPYIVFSDKTLVHMCSVKPANREEMLQVSGVGEMKYQKYGEAFLKCINPQ